MGFALSDMTLTSASFGSEKALAKCFSAEAENISPALNWTNAPANAKSFLVFCHDPDAPLVTPGQYGFVHWVLYNLPAGTHALEEGTTIGTQGVNNFGDHGYGGPLPPPGHGKHQYYFWVAALDVETSFPAGLTLWELLEQAEPNIIAMNRLVGTYQRFE